MVEKQRCPVQRAAVYRWFLELSPAQRVEFLCGLLDMCLPLELRFLGSCLEDLARKDYHSLRDSEIRANNAADLARLTNLTDELVRSRLLVSVALLGSESREAAAVLCRTLTHMDSILNNYGLQLNEARTADELLLLFTMASNHPAFTFHQRQLLRQELDQLQAVVETSGPPGAANPVGQGSSSCRKVTPRIENPSSVAGNSLEKALHTPAHCIEETLPKRHSSKNSKALNVEKIVPKGMPPRKNERTPDYSFEVLWSDSSVTMVTKTSHEVTEFIVKLSQKFPEENLEKFILCRSGADSFSPEKNHMDLKLDLRCLVSLSPHMLKCEPIRTFFSTSSPIQHHQIPSSNTTSHHKLNTPVGVAVRPICGVASIQSSQSSTSQHTTPGVPVSPYSHLGTSGSLPYRSQMEASSLQTSPNLQSPQTQEQQEILEWLRKLRLHKYYTVFSQLSMKKFLSLTEDDLNKFESLTMGAKKKLKTQLELEKEKSEKRCVNPVMCSIGTGIARVPPTSHVEPFQNIRFHHDPDLHVDIDQLSHQIHQEGSSSSEYSSSPSSPRVIQVREGRFDSAEEIERHVPLEGPEREKPIILMNHFSSNSVRPTAQVLPVQNDASSNSSTHHPLQIIKAVSSLASVHAMNSVHKSDRVNADMMLLSSSMHSFMPLEERGKASPGPRSSIKVEKGLGNMVMDIPTQSSLPVPVPENPSGATCFNFGMQPKVVRSSTVDRIIKPVQQQIVESSASSTMSSSTVFHVTRPSVKLLVSSAPSDSSVVRPTSCSSNMQCVSPAVIMPRTALYAANTKVAFSGVSSMPVAPIPGSFCSNNNTASPSSHSTSFANVANLPNCPSPNSSPKPSCVGENNLCNSSGTAVSAAISNPTPPSHHHQQQQTGCTVCSSCGCSGNCGSAGMAVNYANYFQHPFSAPSMFSFPFLPFNPLCGNGYINTHQYNSTPTFPVVNPPYNSSLNNTDSVMSGQSNFAVPPFPGFFNGTAGVYQPQGIIANTNNTGLKKNGNLSCYNCGSSGHRAQDCKQPTMDFNHQGSFRLKYAPPSESIDSAE
ncbi:zinc finger CCHC domain-containing protein 14 [Ambystoma mexicanum]|uniref:zinc finger CCHC domain-containing protein 14 n=1 Tax=Ambystoma mexicanum TaxID=8296 RepID=UPI0037E7AA7D